MRRNLLDTIVVSLYPRRVAPRFCGLGAEVNAMPKNWYQNTTVRAVLAVTLALVLAGVLVGCEEKKPPADLAASLAERGWNYKKLGRLDDAIEEYDKAIVIYTRLVEQEGRSELADDLAYDLLSRGIIRRDQGRREQAIADFTKSQRVTTNKFLRESAAKKIRELGEQ